MNTAEKNDTPAIRLSSVVLDCRDAVALSEFYIRLLGWKRNDGEGDIWVDIVAPNGGTLLGFQKNEDYVPPVWPEEPDAQQQMVHLDFAVKDKEQMERAVCHAIACGATQASVQYGPGCWVTMIDPEGHPFCFIVGN